MNTQRVSNVAGSGFWVEKDGSSTAKVGVVNNRQEAEVKRLIAIAQDQLRQAGFRTRVTGRGVFTLLKVW